MGEMQGAAQTRGLAARSAPARVFSSEEVSLIIGEKNEHLS